MRRMITLVGIIFFWGAFTFFIGAEEPTLFVENAGNPVYGQHLGDGKAYYSSIINFGDHYKMWYDDGSGTIQMVTSPDGLSWSGVTAMTGLTKAHHPAVLYHNDFGYKIYYWDGSVAGLSTKTADSADGINWTDNREISQDSDNYLVGGSHRTWWYHHYGPAQVFYNPAALNSGPNPWDYSFVMTFSTASEGTDDGVGIEHCGLAYSIDGNLWERYGLEPVLKAVNIPTWDGDYSYHGTIARDGNKWRMWYSGSDLEAGGDYYAQGIGEAYSSDGLNWTTFSTPTMHRDDGVPWRTKRTYAPFVLFEDGKYKMWFTGKSDSNYSIGYAEEFVNRAPRKPKKLQGKKRGSPGTSYFYKSKTKDPEQNQIFYMVNWGDGNISDWLGPYNSNEWFSTSHAWDARDNYKIKIKAKDIHGAESKWSKTKIVKIK
ncbi:MAG: hypothetical protein GY757_11835 [bacterium]|nr:hypothetical protein [bacterium]